MSGIDHKHVQDMAKLMAAMAAAEEAPARTSVASSLPLAESNVPVRQAAPMTSDIAAMAKIMEAFSTATDDMVATSSTYPELKKALVTEATETGARVGSWEIVGRAVDGMGKFYNVSHAVTNEPIASDLRLYEAALALVNAFNEGDTITSMRVKTILNAEEEYSRALTDAVHFAGRVKVTEGSTRSVAEDRYAQAKHRALSAKKTLNGISKLF
jgi:hypothetical protein